MKVLFKSLEELKYEYDVKEIIDGYYSIIGSDVIGIDMINLLGKVVEARYDKVSDSYVVDDWYFHPNLVKGIVTGYTIKRLNDDKEYTLSL